MRRNSFGFLRHSSVLAVLFALALTLLFGGVASAASASPAQMTPAPAASCLSLTPATQTVLAGQPATVTAEIVCYSSSTGSVVPSPVTYLYVSWGDGTTSQYPICVEVCRVPPITITTSHIYQLVTPALSADYHPLFCVGSLPTPTPIGSDANCSSVEIIVVSK